MWGEKVDVAGVGRSLRRGRGVEGLNEGANHVRVPWANDSSLEKRMHHTPLFYFRGKVTPKGVSYPHLTSAN